MNFIDKIVGRLSVGRRLVRMAGGRCRNFLTKHRYEDRMLPKIGVFLINRPLQIHTTNLVHMLVSDGFNVDIFLHNSNNYGFVDLRGLSSNKKIKVYDLTYARNSLSLSSYCGSLLTGRYLFFIGVEKEGLILADALSEKFNVPLIYQSLELYVDDHPLYESFIPFRDAEKKCHRKAVATMIQDEHRARALFESNGVGWDGATVLYLPVSVRGDKNAQREKYFHRKYRLPDHAKVILYFGMISGGRFFFDLAEEAERLPEEMVLVFHGYFPDTEDRARAMLLMSRGRLIISEERLPVERVPELVSSADIGIALYRNDYINDRLTAFSSEKVAYFMQSGIPIVSFKNESYETLYSQHRCGEAIESIKGLERAARKILGDHDRYRSSAFAAFDEYYSFEKNYSKIRSFFLNLRR